MGTVSDCASPSLPAFLPACCCCCCCCCCVIAVCLLECGTHRCWGAALQRRSTTLHRCALLRAAGARMCSLIGPPARTQVGSAEIADLLLKAKADGSIRNRFGALASQVCACACAYWLATACVRPRAHRAPDPHARHPRRLRRHTASTTWLESCPACRCALARAWMVVFWSVVAVKYYCR